MSTTTTVDLAAPERITVVRWKCTHCSRSSSSRKAAVQHIGRCWLNPANKTCRTCRYFSAAQSNCVDPGCNGCGSEAFCRVGDELGAYDVTERCPDWEQDLSLYRDDQEAL